MSISFFKTLGLSGSFNPTMLVLHNGFIMVAQVSIKNDKLKLLGFNQVELEKGIIKDGKIYDPDTFQEILKKLLKEAKPSAIKTDSILVNIPFELLYPFLKDFSSKTTEKMVKDSMDDFVSKNSPVSLENLSLHVKTFNNKSFTYGVVGVSKNWENGIKKICKNIGIKHCTFIPEPYVRLALIKTKLVDNFTLFSFHEDRVFVSLFHNQILYDSYFLKFSFSENGQLNCPSCFHEFLVSKENFKNQFNSDISNVYFVGFPKGFQKYIGEFIESKGLNIDFINTSDMKSAKIYKTNYDLITLLGLTEKLLQRS